VIRAPKVISASTPGAYLPVMVPAAVLPKSVEQLQEELAAAERHVAVLRDELSTAQWRREFEGTPE
jgi:hypothetical protein